MENFIEICRKWKEWQKKADKSEDGWQSSFPYWKDLMATAQNTMLKNELTNEELKELELCWAISEETEDLADFAKEHLIESWNILERLSKSKDSNVRWQIYSVFGESGKKGEVFLREGLNDPDPYCRRRALLALAKLAPRDAAQIAKTFVKDPDPYMRQASIEMICVSEDPNFKKQMKNILLKDNIAHVAKAAEKILL